MDHARRLARRAQEHLATVNPLGWTVVTVGLLALAGGLVLHWRELVLGGLTCVLALALALPFLLGRTRVQVVLDLDPERVVAGGSVAGRVAVTNVATGRLRPVVLDLPVGDGVQRYSLPGLAPSARHEETFTIRTERRGVIPVGPATTRRGDPLGLCSRDVTWTERTDVLVRPPMVPLESLGAGLLRDLEGVSTDAVSESDLAFHALREYVPGDDLRHVHWRSSAKAMASGDAQLLVRQYLDTRRSHVTLVVDDLLSSWADADGFETAMSVVASVVVRAVLDDVEVSFGSGDHGAAGLDGHRVLDAVCRADLGSTGLVAAARSAAAAAPDTSLLFLVGGPGTGFPTFERAAASFPPEVRRIAIVVDPATSSRVSEVGTLPVLHLASRDDLAGLLRRSVR